jgi:hypothetical protein
MGDGQNTTSQGAADQAREGGEQLVKPSQRFLFAAAQAGKQRRST